MLNFHTLTNEWQGLPPRVFRVSADSRLSVRAGTDPSDASRLRAVVAFEVKDHGGPEPFVARGGLFIPFRLVAPVGRALISVAAELKRHRGRP